MSSVCFQKQCSVDRTSLEVLTIEYDGSVAENALFQSLKFQCKIVNGYH